MPPVNEDDVEWTDTEHGLTSFRRKRLAAAADAEHLGCSLYSIPAGSQSWPYHYHAGNAEAIYVLAGEGTLRLDGELHDLRMGDYVPLPPGETGAHGIRNDGGTELQFLLVSTMRDPDVTVYPDSDKLGVYTGAAPGAHDGRDFTGYYRRDEDVDYWTDEPDDPWPAADED